MKRAIGMAAAILLAVALAAPAAQATAKPEVGATGGAVPADLNVAPGGVDADHDGINDNLEQALANEYAPVIGMTPGEPNYPVNVDWFLNPPGGGGPTLQYHEDAN